MRVLITGAGGFIGAHMVMACLEKGYDVIANFRDNASAQPAPAADGSLKNLQCDLNELGALPEDVDAIIHAAGVREEAEISEKQYFVDNVLATRRLADRAVAAGVGCFIHISSVAVTDTLGAGVVNELTPPRPRGVYGASKLDSEIHLTMSDPGLRRLIIRLPGVLGHGAHGGFLPSLADKIQAGAAIQLFNANRPFNRAVHIDDLTALVLYALESRSIQYDTVVLGASAAVDLRLAVQTMIDAVQSTSEIFEIQGGAPAPLIDYSFAARRFAYRPTGLSAMLAQYCSKEWLL